MAAVTICSDFGAQENSLSLFPLFPHLYAMKWWDWMPWSSFFEWWILSQLFNSPLFTFIKRLFSSSLLSAVRVVSSAYLRLLIFLPVCNSSLWLSQLSVSHDVLCIFLCVLEKTLESTLDCKEINQSILKEISHGCSLEGLMLNLKLQYFGHLAHLKRPWCWERLKAGEGDDRGWDGWMASPTQWTWVWVTSRSWWWTGRPGMLRFMGSQRVGHDWATEVNWTLHIS